MDQVLASVIVRFYINGLNNKKSVIEDRSAVKKIVIGPFVEEVYKHSVLN